MIFGMASTGFASADNSQKMNQLKGMPDLDVNQQASVARHLQGLRAELATNNKALSKEHKKLANKALTDYKKTLTFATMLNSDPIVLLSTEQPNVQVSITGNTIDVVERIDMETYIINGERHEFEFTFTNEDGSPFTSPSSGQFGTMAYDGWYSSGYKPGPWTVESGSRWVNVNASRNYSASTLGGIIGGPLHSCSPGQQQAQWHLVPLWALLIIMRRQASIQLTWVKP